MPLTMSFDDSLYPIAKNLSCLFLQDSLGLKEATFVPFEISSNDSMQRVYKQRRIGYA